MPNLFLPKRQRKAASVSRIEPLEWRRLFASTITTAIDDMTITPNSAPSTIDLSNRYKADTTVRFMFEYGQYTQGEVIVGLTDSVTPLTVANFLTYVDSGEYNHTFIHRAAANFVLQMGGYTGNIKPTTHIHENAPITNEFQKDVTTNVRGTLAFAKSDGDPNSAKAEFFFNLANNTSNLDSQNGGFATFGKVLSGMFVVDAMGLMPRKTPGNLRRVNETSPFDNLPVRDLAIGATVTPANLLYLESVTRLTPYTLKVTSDNPSLVKPKLNGQQLTLDYAQGKAGKANVTVSITTPDGKVTNDTFAVTVGSTDTSNTISLGGANPKSMRYTDADGSIVNLSITRGTATVVIKGSNVFNFRRSSRFDVTGSGLAVDSISVEGTSGNGALNISVSGGDGLTTAASITSAQGLTRISAANVDVSGATSVTGNLSSLALNSTGSVSISGAATSITLTRSGAISADSIRTLKANTITGNVTTTSFLTSMTSTTYTGQTISIGGSTGSTRLSLGAVSGSSLTSTLPIRSLVANSWSGTGTVTAPSIASLVSKGAFAPNVTLSGASTGKTLGSASIADRMGPSTWNITGDAGSLTVGSLASSSNLTVSGALASFVDKSGAAALTLSAASVRTMKINGELLASTITLTAPLSAKTRSIQSLNITGNLTDTTISSTGNVGSITAAGMSGSHVRVGTSNNLPTQLSDFNGATLGLIHIPRKSDGTTNFSNNTIAAKDIGTASVGSVLTSNGGTSFGIVADKIASLAFYNGASKVAKSKLDATTDSQNTQDFVVTLL